jgi:hypothetical protein
MLGTYLLTFDVFSECSAPGFVVVESFIFREVLDEGDDLNGSCF